LEFILCGFNELEGNALEHALKMLEKVDPKKKQTGFAELFQVRNKCNIYTVH
jgi:nitrate reductase assembly molybdenum cofactor insertion protein NarJ